MFGFGVYARRAALGCAAAAVLCSVSLCQAGEGEPVLGRLAGFVYVDRNNDGHIAFNNTTNPELTIGGAEVKLFSVTNNVTQLLQTVLTSNIGRYLFPNLPAGTYRIQQTQPLGYIDGIDTLGELRDSSNVLLNVGIGTASNDLFTDVVLSEGDYGDMYNFGELGLAPSFVSKRYLLGTAPPPVFSPPVEDLDNVPEPSGMALLALGAGAAWNSLRRRRRQVDPMAS
jgi:hypothetical protein